MEPAAKRVRLSPEKALVWFRNDLRVHDNPALSYAFDLETEVVAVFLVCLQELESHNMGPRKVDFILRSLKSLRQELEKLNVPLLFVTVNEPKEVPPKILELCKKHNCKYLAFNKEYELDERKRDEKVSTLLEENAIDVEMFHAQCIVPPGLVMTKESRHYAVFTPFRNCWYGVLASLIHDPHEKFMVSTPSEPQEPIEGLASDPIPEAIEGFQLSQEEKERMASLWPAGEREALARLGDFMDKRGHYYKINRDIPSVKGGTSALSPYLSVGSISARKCLMRARDQNGERLESGNLGLVTWISELAWRDFYRHIMYFVPRICKYKPYKLDTDQVAWNYNQENFQKWCQGKTGYPLVDAGMRQLNQTGWMHNRLRMLVATFLSKHLLIDWRMGEKYFSRNLIDADLASNNGGWQWAASTGTDAQPYFRIFNPTTQSTKFDPAGTFIRDFVPELASATKDEIHEPWKSNRFLHFNYPRPMVDHALARERALAAFKVLAKK